jgi:hypothetical protein
MSWTRAENDADSDLMCVGVHSSACDEEHDKHSDEVCIDVDSCAYDAENNADLDPDVDFCMQDTENDADSEVMCGDMDSCVTSA